MDKMELELRQLLVEGASSFGVSLDEGQVDKFFTYGNTLKEWNKKMNLTAIEDDREIILKHFIDSISICPIIKDENLTLIDVGTGAGFPGIPVKIVFPNIKIRLLDSLEKRTKFLEEVINRLSLNEISAVHSRAEDKGIASDYRERYDISTARAVANLPVLLEYCLPFVKVGGLFIAMKGSNTEEIDNSKKALDILGGKIEDILEFNLPFSDIKRNVVVIKKCRQTPTKYPRKSGKPSKDPLM